MQFSITKVLMLAIVTITQIEQVSALALPTTKGIDAVSHSSGRAQAILHIRHTAETATKDLFNTVKKDIISIAESAVDKVLPRSPSQNNDIHGTFSQKAMLFTA